MCSGNPSRDCVRSERAAHFGWAWHQSSGKTGSRTNTFTYLPLSYDPPAYVPAFSTWMSFSINLCNCQPSAAPSQCDSDNEKWIYMTLHLVGPTHEKEVQSGLAFLSTYLSSHSFFKRYWRIRWQILKMQGTWLCLFEFLFFPEPLYVLKLEWYQVVTNCLGHVFITSLFTK